MISELLAMRADIERLKSAFGSSLKVGPVAAIDPVKGYRVKLGSNAQGDHLSPWYPHPESGGQNSSWVPLSVGQVVGVLNPNGDPRQGILVRGGFSGINPPISDDPDAVVFEFGAVKITISGGNAVIDAPGKVTVNAGEVNLGGEGGPKVARIGDMVSVSAGSSAGLWPIVTGSDVVSAV